MGVVYVAVAVMIVPVLLGSFHLLSRAPKVTSQPGGPVGVARPGEPARPPRASAADSLRLEAGRSASLADEAEDWLRSQRRS